jgi:sodium transport system permease protein
MKWSNIKLIFFRELRDQLRDRRTMFTIAVLPILLYPLMGMAFFQISQFMHEHESTIRIVGLDNLPSSPELMEGEHFHPDICNLAQARLLILEIQEGESPSGDKDLQTEAEQDINAGVVDAVVVFPPNFGQQLDKFREQFKDRTSNPESESESESDAVEIPQPQVFFNTASDKSRIALERLDVVLHRWRDSMVRENLARSNIPLKATRPFSMEDRDVSHEETRRAAIWSKFLPFILVIWALTGAFYPAVDVCAGEKERGTLETLLSSPATRTEIVYGKWLTVMTFSMATAILNLVSMGATGTFIMKSMESMAGMGGNMGTPPLVSMGWLLLCLPLISGLFSALSLAVAAFARSSKEGQYYLMPLLFVTLPLIMLPMLPAAELDFGTSLIPVAGMTLLMRALMESQFQAALLHTIPVLVVTCVCCYLAIRWAVAQFESESVMFPETERWDISSWLLHLRRDRGETPTVGEAILCGVLILVIKFFGGSVIKAVADSVFTDHANWNYFAFSTIVIQIGIIALPAVIMAIILTRNPRKSLMLTMPKWSYLPAAVLLALFLHPAFMYLGQGIVHLYPFDAAAEAAFDPIEKLLSNTPLLYLLFVVALMPAICEELAFRGFIMSGLRHSGHKWFAIVISSFLFGITHGVLQQSISAGILGIVVGYLAVQTGSLIPTMLFHFTHNATSMVMSRLNTTIVGEYQPLGWLFTALGKEGGVIYHWHVAVIGATLAAGLLYWLRKQPYEQYDEEILQEALDKATTHTSVPTLV